MVREMVKKGLFLASQDLGTPKPMLKWEMVWQVKSPATFGLSGTFALPVIVKELLTHV